MRWGIRRQLFVPLGALLVGIVGTSAWTASSAADRARRQVAERVGDVVRTLGDAKFPLTQSVLGQMRGLSGAEYVLDLGGRTVATLPLARPTWGEVRAGEGGDLGLPVDVNGTRYLIRAVGLRPPHPNSGATLHVLYPEALLDDEIRAAVLPSIVLGIGGGAVAMAMALVVGRRFVGRIRDIEQRTRAIASGDFRPVPPGPRDDEFRDLAASVNDMADQLHRAQDGVQRAERMRLLGQVSGGLAHQLRNAVAGAKLAVQLHADGDPEALEVALRQLSRVEADLSRFLDLGRERAFAEPVRLVALVDESLQLLAPQARHAGVALEYEGIHDDPVIQGDPSRLRHVLLNLITNAIEAAGPDGVVTVSLDRDGGTWLLTVADTGPGPDAGVAVFEAFVTAKPDGIGLGLFVARQAVEDHGGTIDWQRDGDRTAFRVRLPAETP